MHCLISDRDWKGLQRGPPAVAMTDTGRKYWQVLDNTKGVMLFLIGYELLLLQRGRVQCTGAECRAACWTNFALGTLKAERHRSIDRRALSIQ